MYVLMHYTTTPPYACMQRLPHEGNRRAYGLSEITAEQRASFDAGRLYGAYTHVQKICTCMYVRTEQHPPVPGISRCCCRYCVREPAKKRNAGSCDSPRTMPRSEIQKPSYQINQWLAAGWALWRRGGPPLSYLIDRKRGHDSIVCPATGHTPSHQAHSLGKCDASFQFQRENFHSHQPIHTNSPHAHLSMKPRELGHHNRLAARTVGGTRGVGLPASLWKLGRGLPPSSSPVCCHGPCRPC
jgi:hypothetical protein